MAYAFMCLATANPGMKMLTFPGQHPVAAGQEHRTRTAASRCADNWVQVTQELLNQAGIHTFVGQVNRRRAPAEQVQPAACRARNHRHRLPP